jgi:hypothetical protein
VSIRFSRTQEQSKLWKRDLLFQTYAAFPIGRFDQIFWRHSDSWKLMNSSPRSWGSPLISTILRGGIMLSLLVLLLLLLLRVHWEKPTLTSSFFWWMHQTFYKIVNGRIDGISSIVEPWQGRKSKVFIHNFIFVKEDFVSIERVSGFTFVHVFLR